MGRIRFFLFKLLLRDELSRLEGEIEEEFRFHIDMKAASLEADGMDPKEAKDAARRCFGDAALLQRAGMRAMSEARQKERRASSLDSLWQDLRTGVRQMARRPGFAILAAATLALGLSTGTAVFTYVNAYLRPFPGADARDLYQIYQGSEEAPFGPISYPDYLDLTEAGEGRFEVGAVATTRWAASVRHETLTEVVFGQGVTGNFFQLARVGMSIGRALSVEDDLSGAPPTVVISHRYWVRRYGSEPGGAGRDAISQQPTLHDHRSGGPGLLRLHFCVPPRRLASTLSIQTGLLGQV